MENKAVILELKNNILVITLNKPKSLNALDDDIKRELMQAMEEAHNNSDIKAVVITGEGRAFSAGGDLNSLALVSSASQGRERIKKLHDLIYKFVNLEKPIIAAVNGYAVGAGCNLALACDIILASNKAKFSEIFSKVGLIPDAGGLYFLPRLVGPMKAKELVFTAQMIEAEEAKRIGLVNRIVDEENLLPEAMELAEQLAKGPSKAIGLAKALINQSMGWDLNTLLESEALAQGICMNTDDFKEGVKAFQEKREPKFNGY